MGGSRNFVGPPSDDRGCTPSPGPSPPLSEFRCVDKPPPRPGSRRPHQQSCGRGYRVVPKVVLCLRYVPFKLCFLIIDDVTQPHCSPSNHSHRPRDTLCLCRLDFSSVTSPRSLPVVPPPGCRLWVRDNLSRLNTDDLPVLQRYDGVLTLNDLRREVLNSP